MRAYVGLIDGTVSTELPFRPNEYTQTVKGLSGERVELKYVEDGAGVLLPSGTQMRLSVRDTPGGVLLAELTDFTAPESAEGFYIGRLSLNTEAVLALLDANPTKNAFACVGEFAWLVPGAAEWEVSDDLIFSLKRGVGAGDDPLVLVSPFDWLVGSLVAGSNVTLTVDDNAKTITIAATGGGVGGGSSAWEDITGKPTTLAGYGIIDALTDALAATTYQAIITDGALTIARTNGLQAALDTKLSSVAAAAAYQPLSSALTIYAGISPSVNVRAILSAADYAAVRTLLGLLIGSNVQAYSANLDTLAAGLGASIGQRLVAWDGSAYALLSGALPPGYGGTGISSYAIGDMLYYGAGGMQKLAGNTTTTKKFLTQTGDGTTAGAPAYGQIQAADVPTLNQNTTGTAAAASGLKTLSNTVVVSAAAAPSAGMQLVATSATTAEWQYPKVELVISASNTTDNLTTGTLKETFRMPHAMTLTSVRISCSTAPTGSVIIVDVKEAGTSIFSTKPQIADGAKTSVGGAVPGVLSDTSLADDAEITINLDQIGSSVAGKGLKVTLIGTRS